MMLAVLFGWVKECSQNIPGVLWCPYMNLRQLYSDFTSLKETSGVKSCFVYFKGYLDFWILIQTGYYFIYLA
jgi:hypothetical protein